MDVVLPFCRFIHPALFWSRSSFSHIASVDDLVKRVPRLSFHFLKWFYAIMKSCRLGDKTWTAWACMWNLLNIQVCHRFDV